MVWNTRRKLEEMTLEDFRDHPRASSWIMAHEEIVRIVEYMRILQTPKILDAGCGSGFVTALFALEGLDALGVNIEPFREMSLAHISGLRLETGDVAEAKWYKGRNIIFNSWMPQFNDWSGYFGYAKPQPQMIVYVSSPCTGIQPGMANNPNNLNAYYVFPGFVEVNNWPCFGNNDLVTGKLETKTGRISVRVQEALYRRKKQQFEEIGRKILTVPPYNWEKELPNL